MAVALLEVAVETVHEKIGDTAVHGGESSTGEENTKYRYTLARRRDFFFPKVA